MGWMRFNLIYISLNLIYIIYMMSEWLIFCHACFRHADRRRERDSHAQTDRRRERDSHAQTDRRVSEVEQQRVRRNRSSRLMWSTVCVLTAAG